MKKQDKLILITGGAGFIGSHTVDFLLKKKIRVRVLDNLYSGIKDNLPLNNHDLNFLQKDIRDYSEVTKALKDVTHVLHLAAMVSVANSVLNPKLSHEINSQGFVNLLNGVREINPSIRVVYASSSAIYGSSINYPYKESAAENSIKQSPYALDKWQNEELANLYRRLYDMNLLGLRYFNVYGLRQNPSSPYSGVITKFSQNAILGKPLEIFGDGSQTRDFIAVDDVVKANYLALISDYNGILNIATGKSNTINQLAEIFKRLSKTPTVIRHGNGRVGDVEHSSAKTYRATKCLGFKAKVKLQDGIKLLLGGLR